MKKKISIKSLATHLTLKEGKKHQASISDVREILALLSDLMAVDADLEIAALLIKNGQRRLRAHKK